jgi:hypothetical protein
MGCQAMAGVVRAVGNVFQDIQGLQGSSLQLILLILYPAGGRSANAGRQNPTAWDV